MTGRIEMLKNNLRILAADADTQLRYLEQQEVPVGIDELALDYDAIAAAADNMLTEGEINKAQYDCVKKLDKHFNSFSGAANGELWEEVALRSSEEWELVREMAAECLRLLG
jgi:two-component sensor histidine kinase